jgi:hypothetical protein
MLDEKFVNAIDLLSQKAMDTRIIEVEGRRYSTKGLTPVMLPVPKAFEVDTLTAIKDYLTGNPDQIALTGTIVVVDAPDSVSIWSKLTGDFQQRFLYLRAKWNELNFSFGQFYDIEKFIIGLQASFIRRPDVETILKVVGNIKEGVVKNFDDDGVTQQVTVKAGVTRVAEIPVPNPVSLAPYRTFPEVDQPPSNFIFRMRTGDPAPTCALFEADGGRWRIEAAASVKEWLTENLPEGVTVLA